MAERMIVSPEGRFDEQDEAGRLEAVGDEFRAEWKRVWRGHLQSALVAAALGVVFVILRLLIGKVEGGPRLMDNPFVVDGMFITALVGTLLWAVTALVKARQEIKAGPPKASKSARASATQFLLATHGHLLGPDESLNQANMLPAWVCLTSAAKEMCSDYRRFVEAWKRSQIDLRDRVTAEAAAHFPAGTGPSVTFKIVDPIVLQSDADAAALQLKLLAQAASRETLKSYLVTAGARLHRIGERWYLDRADLDWQVAPVTPTHGLRDVLGRR